MTEIWSSLVGLEGFYEVSSLGRVRSLSRVDALGRSIQGRVLAPRVHYKTGYTHYTLSVNSTRYEIMAHRAVCEAFHGAPPEGKEWALHRDGDPGNNSVENLYWGDGTDNLWDTVRHGRHYNAKKETCPQGHKYDRAYGPRGWRKCSVCEAETAAKGLPEGDERHGTPRGWKYYGCRCEECREAYATYSRNYRNLRNKNG
jgi:NUMOD4 motif/HNH endonuclease